MVTFTLKKTGRWRLFASKREAPRWRLLDVQRLRKGNRLPITPFEPLHWRVIVKGLGGDSQMEISYLRIPAFRRSLSIM